MIDNGYAEFLEEELGKLAHPENGESETVRAIATGFLLLAHRLQEPKHAVKGPRPPLAVF